MLGMGVVLVLLWIGAGVGRAAEAGEAVSFGAPGGTALVSATALNNESSYRGTVHRGGALWYKFDSQGAERVLVNVWGRTRTCPVRATVLNAHRRVLGELISSSAEILPFAAPLPARPFAGAYYLRIDEDPYSACATGRYVLELVEPQQPSPAPPALAPAPGAVQPEMTAPATNERSIVPGRCNTALYTLSRATVVLERERWLVRRHRAGIASLRGAEARKLQARRRERAICGYE